MWIIRRLNNQSVVGICFHRGLFRLRQNLKNPRIQNNDSNDTLSLLLLKLVKIIFNQQGHIKERKYGMFKLLILAICSVFFLTGCWDSMMQIRTYDRVPKNEPKGYIDFYNKGANYVQRWQDWRTVPPRWFFKKYVDGELTKITSFLREGNGQPYVYRFADHPGNHAYHLKVGTGEWRIPVEVVEGMITPVQIEFVKTAVSHSSFITSLNVITSHFEINIEVEKPTPYLAKKKLPEYYSVETLKAKGELK